MITSRFGDSKSGPIYSLKTLGDDVKTLGYEVKTLGYEVKTLGYNLAF